MTPQIVDRLGFAVVGMAIQTKPMSPDIPALWTQFVARIPEIPNQPEPSVSYGVMHYEPDKMDGLFYMAGQSVSPVERVPKGMTSLAIRAGTYAVFTYPLSALTQGFCEIFERWLPASAYRQAAGPYFERYGETFDPGDPHSNVEIYLPVECVTARA